MDQPFYSSVNEAIDNLPQPKGTGAQMLAMLMKYPGVKKQELDDRGLHEIAQRPKVSKDELQTLAQQQAMPPVNVVKKGGAKNIDSDKVNEWVNKNAINRAQQSGDIESEKDWLNASQDIKDWHIDYAKQDWKRAFAHDPDQFYGESNPTKFHQWRQPGGENYGETLLTLPVPNGDKKRELQRQILTQQETIRQALRYEEAQQNAGSSSAKARELRVEAEAKLTALEEQLEKIGGASEERNYGHWDEPNVLAHFRHTDRVDPEGKKVLFVEEVQSDWGQKGRDKGFVPDRSRMRVEAGPAIDFPQLTLWRAYDDNGEVRGVGDTREQALADFKNRYHEIPRGPFVTSTEGWSNLALKHIIDKAAKEGYDKVAFVRGQQAADLYDQTKYVETVQYNAHQKMLQAFDHDGNEVVTKSNVQPDDLPGIIGKEPAERLIAQEGNGNNGRGVWQVLTGEDLKIGGEGMRAYYDKHLPNYLNKLLPKVGGKLGKVTVPETGEHMGFDVTPEMRQHVTKRGQPMYDEGGTVNHKADGGDVNAMRYALANRAKAK